ncbi:hypothetical protein ACSSS7_007584 [Eimeria intestinalis]
MEGRQGQEPPPIEGVPPQVSKLIAEQQQALLRQQQAINTLEFRLLTADKSPPRAMEIETADFFAQADQGEFRSHGSAGSPRTRAEWSALCAQLIQKRSLSRDDFLGVVWGYAAHVGIYDSNPWEFFGDIYHVYKIAAQASPTEYRSLIQRYYGEGPMLEMPHRKRQRLNPVRRALAKRKRSVDWLRPIDRYRIIGGQNGLRAYRVLSARSPSAGSNLLEASPRTSEESRRYQRRATDSPVVGKRKLSRSRPLIDWAPLMGCAPQSQLSEVRVVTENLRLASLIRA